MTETPATQCCRSLLFTLLVPCLFLGAEVSLAQHADVLVSVTEQLAGTTQQLTVNERLFLADFRAGLSNNGDVLELKNPGFATEQANELLAGTLLSFDIVGPLLFSDGTAWRPAEQGEFFELYRPLVENQSATVTGESNSQSGFLLAEADAQGVIHEHIRFRLGTENDGPPAQGVYAVQQVLTSPAYADSDPFLLAFNHGLGTSDFIQSVIAARQLIADSEFDCSGDGLLTADDLPCVSEIIQRDTALRSIGSVAGDLDGNQTVDFADFLTLSRNFGTNATSYDSGNVDLSAGVGFPDFLILARNFGFENHTNSAPVPEPHGWLNAQLALFFLAALRRRSNASKERIFEC